MSLALISKTYGAEYAGYRAVVRDSLSNTPIRLYMRANGGLVSANGELRLDAEGAINLYAAIRGTYYISIFSNTNGTIIKQDYGVEAGEAPPVVSSSPIEVVTQGTGGGRSVVGLRALGGLTAKVALTTTWASKPLPSAYQGLAYVTDIGKGGSFWYSNGATWELSGGRCVLYTSAIASAAFTGSLTVTTLRSVIIPGGVMGPDGAIEVRTKWSGTNNANLKIAFTRLNGTTVSGVGFTTAASQGVRHVFQNRGSEASQLTSNGAAVETTNGGTDWGTTTINTALDTTLSFDASLANVADSMTLQSYTVELIR